MGIEPAIEPKTVDAVKAWVNGGGKLKVGGDVLVGLKRWETLVSKTPEVDKLLANMPDELEAALAQKGKLITPKDLPSTLTAAQKHTALGYQAKGLEFATLQAKGTDLSCMLLAPQVLHAKPRSLVPGTRFTIMTDAAGSKKDIVFEGFGKMPNGDLTLRYLLDGQTVQFAKPDPDAAVSATAKSGPRKATPGDKHHLACVVPGEVLTYSVAVGDVLEAGAPLCTLESMKMEMKIAVPDEIAGLKVKSLPCNVRTKTDQGAILAPGDLLLELEDA